MSVQDVPVHVVVDATQVQLVKQVEEVGLKLDPGSFPQNGHGGKSEGLGQGCIHIKVARTAESIPTDAGCLRNGSWLSQALHDGIKRRSGHGRWLNEVSGTTLR